jgi:hypothetical protein
MVHGFDMELFMGFNNRLASIHGTTLWFLLIDYV